MRRSIVCVGLLTLLMSFTSVSAALVQDTTPDLPWTWSLQSYKKLETIRIGDNALTVEVADTGDLQTRGLSYRDGLEPGTGMLFVYTESENHSFWMKGMRFCLDIIWINDGKIKGAAENACPEPGVADGDLARYQSTGPAQFVLEVPAGWLKENGYGAGAEVDLSQIDASPELAGG